MTEPGSTPGSPARPTRRIVVACSVAGTRVAVVEGNPPEALGVRARVASVR